MAVVCEFMIYWHCQWRNWCVSKYLCKMVSIEAPHSHALVHNCVVGASSSVAWQSAEQPLNWLEELLSLHYCFTEVCVYLFFLLLLCFVFPSIKSSLQSSFSKICKLLMSNLYVSTSTITHCTNCQVDGLGLQIHIWVIVGHASMSLCLPLYLILL